MSSPRNYFRRRAPASVAVGDGSVSAASPMDRDYDYGPASPPQAPQSRVNWPGEEEEAQPAPASQYDGNRRYSHSPRSPQDPPSLSLAPAGSPGSPTTGAAARPPTILDGDEALLDLAQLEELHREAEKMKALGNKHMATQEYTRAYNAYSAALQLSPVGPSSHVFLSNRAAALLSLKRYNAAATDARRAIALAPTFGKAHARLGQALYFLKDYGGAVAAYEDAIHYEPDNHITRTYLEKAQAKLERQHRKLQGGADEGVSVADSHQHYVPSVATADPRATDNRLIGAAGYHGRGASALATAAARRQMSPNAAGSASASPTANPRGTPGSPSGNVSLLGTHYSRSYADPNADPDFEEALRIQQQANKYLAHKQYKEAIEEYTAALFLVPDDVNLSPELHLGRAHALNGSRRHERARNDCLLAVKLKPSPAAYSTLAKSYFYMQDYRASLQAFRDCMALLPPGESLGMFDRAYYEKAEAALEDEEAGLSQASPARGGASVYSNKTVPKLPPPRFVARDEAIQLTPNLPAMPKQWPQQSPLSPTTFRCGPEREVLFLSESLGIKLNRGSDGIVRIVSVVPPSPASQVARHGEIGPGDVIRECAGVDLRRPITNIMWGDTVALIKMAPRPISFIVAKELSEVPPVVQEELRRAHGSPQNGYPVSHRPSNVNGEEAVRGTEVSTELDTLGQEDESSRPMEARAITDANAYEMESNVESNPVGFMSEKSRQEQAENTGIAGTINFHDENNVSVSTSTHIPEPTDCIASESLELRGLEDRLIGGEILFARPSPPAYFNWDNLRWLSYSGVRKVSFCQRGYRLFERERKQLFWSSDASTYEERLLAIYDEPSLILILRRPANEEDVANLLGFDDIGNEEIPVFEACWIVESVIEPSTCLLRLSPLTSVCAIPPPDADERRLSCFELRTPVESILFSPVKTREDVKVSERSFSDSGAFLETSAAETALKIKLCRSHNHAEDLGVEGADIAWKHQIIQGTLHSFVVSGNSSLLEKALECALVRVQADTDGFANVCRLPSRIVDEADESGFTPLYYAVHRRMSRAVVLLMKAGANTDFREARSGMTLVHICARNLDHESLAIILASDSPKPNPNALDVLGRTPMYVACVESNKDVLSLKKCLHLLQTRGGLITIGGSLLPVASPLAVLASLWRAEALAVVFDHLHDCFLLYEDGESDGGVITKSLGALHHYPLHSAISAFHQNVLPMKPINMLGENPLIRTLRVLLEHGFEVNERMDYRRGMEENPEFLGFTPLQVLISVSRCQDYMSKCSDLSECHGVQSVFKDAASFLTRHGGRLFVDTPPISRPFINVASESDLAIGLKLGTDPPRNCINWSSKIDVATALGLDDADVKEIAREWNDLKAIPASSRQFLLETGSDFTDGGDDRYCAICWKQFGTLLNRKHQCSVTKQFLCDECSSKRLVRNDKKYRVSDGQYNLARSQMLKPTKLFGEPQAFVGSDVDREIINAEAIGSQGSQIKRRDAQLETDRNTLLGDMLDQATGFIFGSDDSQKDNPPSTLSGLASTLSDTRNALNQRGDKLSQLGEKSADLVDASENFAKMAKELARKSEQGFFW